MFRDCKFRNILEHNINDDNCYYVYYNDNDDNDNNMMVQGTNCGNCGIIFFSFIFLREYVLSLPLPKVGPQVTPLHAVVMC